MNGLRYRSAVLLGLVLFASGGQSQEVWPRPHILWITCEDISPHLGCYGDTYAVTPNLDRLASQSVRYTHAFAPIGVCAPARSCLITGMYPPSLGTQHMRCQGQLPAAAKCFPQYLREAGYYCTNNVKTDYNFSHPKATWDESSNRAHWRARAPGQPFFSVFNFTTSHESQIRLSEAQYQKRTADFTAEQRHDPARAVVPPYHPDTPAVRRDWARYADMITYMDQEVGKLLADLEAEGLADDTIVFFFSDHGAGMPRSKRWLYDSSLRVPLLVRVPAKYAEQAPGEAGTTSGRLVSFVDFGPTVLSLAGVELPRQMQGLPFLGRQAAPPREYVYGYRDRMDERYDMLRAVRDPRYKYIRNYLPQLPYFHHQFISYMYEMPTMRVWQDLADAGRLQGPAALFMAPRKPIEELYDTEADPHEVRNLAESAEHQEVLHRMRKALDHWVTEIRDLGFLPESDLRTRFGSTPPYDAVRQAPASYPFERIKAAAELASRAGKEDSGRLRELTAASDPAVRFWGATGLGSLTPPDTVSLERLEDLLNDPSPAVRVAAADALARLGQTDVVPPLVDVLQGDNEWARLAAINVLDRMDQDARTALPELRRHLQDENPYVVRVAEHAVQQLEPGSQDH